MENVVITGIGLASALGHDIETFWANLLAGKSGVSNILISNCLDFLLFL